MAARIVNDLMPEEEGILFDSVSEAEAAFAYMIFDYKRQGYTVTETDAASNGNRRYSVVDRSRRPFGIYSLKA
jgi:hypothetical protein